MAMTTGRKLGIGAVVLAALAAAVLGASGLLRSMGSDSSKNGTAANSSSESSGGHDTDADQAAATITYSDDGFSPAATTVEAGDTVAIKNESSGTLGFHSDPHPSHTTNSELNVGDIAAGETKVSTVATKGTFGFHDHYAPDHSGKITVE